jgi:hypothetical protein
MASWLRGRGIRTEGLEMRALVPVSVRSKEERGTLGNRLAVMRGPLPVYISDPVARLRYVKNEMDGLKESKQAVGAATLAAVNNLAPPNILAQASRLQFSTRLFNLLVTNIPGPQFPLYVLGRKLEDLFPLAFLPENHALAVAIMSYNGEIAFGLLGDFDALPDIDVVADGLDEALQELVDAARGKQGSGAARGKRSAAAGRSTGKRDEAKAGETRDENKNGDGAGNGAAPRSIVPSTRRRPSEGPAAAMRAKRGQSRRRTSKNDGQNPEHK